MKQPQIELWDNKKGRLYSILISKSGIQWTLIPFTDTRWEYKDTVERLGFWYGISEYLKRIAQYWFDRVFYNFYEGHDDRFTYYKKFPKWVKIENGLS